MNLFAYISKFQVHKVINLELSSVIVFMRLRIVSNIVLSFCLKNFMLLLKTANIP